MVKEQGLLKNIFSFIIKKVLKKIVFSAPRLIISANFHEKLL